MWKFVHEVKVYDVSTGTSIPNYCLHVMECRKCGDRKKIKI